MREIKFRAYGEIQCYYLTSSGWKPKKQMCQVSSLNIKTHKCRVLYKGENGTNEYDTFELSKVNLMQYTGLKDKNGKEIYEGDVVKDYYCEYVDDKYTVGFSDGLFYPLVQVEQGYNCIDKYDKNRFEVIGNIYENPELLKND